MLRASVCVLTLIKQGDAPSARSGCLLVSFHHIFLENGIINGGVGTEGDMHLPQCETLDLFTQHSPHPAVLLLETRLGGVCAMLGREMEMRHLHKCFGKQR